jgi:hypothetical protein
MKSLLSLFSLLLSFSFQLKLDSHLTIYLNLIIKLQLSILSHSIFWEPLQTFTLISCRTPNKIYANSFRFITNWHWKMRYMTFFSLGRKNALPYSPSMCWLYGHELRYFSILRTIENQACYILPPVLYIRKLLLFRFIVNSMYLDKNIV